MSQPSQILVGVLGLAILVSILFRHQLRRIWAFRRRRPYRAAESAARVAFFRPRQYKVSRSDLRDFASSLLLGTSMNVTLGQALQKTAEQFEERGVFGARLNRHVEARLAESPDAVLRGLARDFRSQYLEDMVRHIEISRQAGARLTDALTLTVETIEEDIRAGVSFDIRRAANQLTVPMILGVFMPIVILGVLPLLWDFVAQLS